MDFALVLGSPNGDQRMTVSLTYPRDLSPKVFPITLTKDCGDGQHAHAQ